MWQIISAFICGFISTLEVFMFAKIVLKEKGKISTLNLSIAFLILSIIYAILYLNIVGTIKTLIIFLLNLFFYKYIFKVSTKKAIFIVFLCLVLLIVPDLLELFFVTKVLGLSMDFCYNTLSGSIISNIIICMLFILITYMTRKILRKLINTEIENDIKIIIFSILIFICTGMLFYTIIKEYQLNDNIIIYLISIIVLVGVLFSLMKQTITNNKLTEQYDKLLEFMKKYEKEAEEQRILRHETKNEFIAIKGKLCDRQDTKEIIDYINEILHDKIELKQEVFAKFVYLPANGIKGLCYFKTQEAQDKGLKTSINISKRIENSNIYKLNVKEQRDLGKILGVFLDNAIEASLNSNDKEFGIESYLNINKECEIIISNSFDGKIDIDKIGNESFTTKGKNRGHGLLLAKRLVDKNNKFEMKTKSTNGLFIQTLTIKNLLNNNY